MQEAQRILDLSKRARSRGEQMYLATVVHVQGSSYRKPGARMLVTAGGERAGTISGGCLEAEVGRKIAWLTVGGAFIARYSSSFDDENEGVPYGAGVRRNDLEFDGDRRGSLRGAGCNGASAH